MVPFYLMNSTPLTSLNSEMPKVEHGLHTYNFMNVKQCNCKSGNDMICLYKEFKLERKDD